MRCRSTNRWLAVGFCALLGLILNHVFYFELRRWLIGPFRLALTAAESLPPPLRPDQCLDFVLASLPPSRDDTALRTPKRLLPVSALPFSCRGNFQAPDNSALSKEQLDCFRGSNFRPEDFQVIQRDLRVLRDAFAAANLPLFLTAGSLLGSWRHHGIIPYDSDIDFRVRWSDRVAVRALLQDLARKDRHFHYFNLESLIGHLQVALGSRWAANGTFLSSVSFADFFFLWNTSIGVGVQEPPQILPLEAVYPPRKRPFEGLLFDALADYPRYFAFVYGAGLQKCERNKGSRHCPPTDCRLLRSVLPFVVTFGNSSFVAEVLVREGMVRSVFTRPAG